MRKSLVPVLLLLSCTSLDAQQPLRGPNLPMHPQYERGQPVSPIFEGWYENPDGTYTLSFGYFSRNSEETLEIPLGPDNIIEPAEFDGLQPTSFPSQTGTIAVGREWGAFTVVVPAEYAEPGHDVVWTLRSKGATHSVPGRVGNHTYQLAGIDEPMGVGSLSPRLRFGPDGAEGVGPGGVLAEPTTASVGAPLTLAVWAADSRVTEEWAWEPVPVELRWFKHQGPVDGDVAFEEDELEVPPEGGEASTTVTFSEPGEYVLRVRAGNFDAPDSRPEDQCCWTNGYVEVTVTRD